MVREDYTLSPTEIPDFVAEPLPRSEADSLKDEITQLLSERDAVLVSHYYVDGDVQDIATETGGCVSDSLEMARFGRDHPASTLFVAGVRFMGETAKILSPEKRVFMPTLNAECSLDLGCPPDEFKEFCEQHPDRTVVVYANTSVEVKALSDWVVTSSVGLQIVERLKLEGKRIIWAPDKHLGNYIRTKTDADMLLWSAACVVHEEFKYQALLDMKELYPRGRCTRPSRVSGSGHRYSGLRRFDKPDLESSIRFATRDVHRRDGSRDCSISYVRKNLQSGSLKHQPLVTALCAGAAHTVRGWQ